MSFWDNLLHTVTDVIQDTAATVTDVIQDTAATVTDVIQDPGALTDVIQDTAATVTDVIQDPGALTDVIQDTAATVTDVIQDPGPLTDVIQDTAATVTDFLEIAGITYGNYGGLNYSAGVEGGTITETSPPPINAYDAAFYLHDLAYQSSSDPAVRLPADIQVVESLIDLTEQGGGSVNVLTGRDGDDIQMGGDGVDWIYGGLGNDRQNGGAGTDGVFGGAGNDILVLGAGHDAGWGGADDDYISGGTGNDFLFGGAGDDWLDGESERDYLSGGTEADTFMFVDAFGQDFVSDFRQGEDTLEFQVAGVSGFDDLDIVLNGSDTVISTTASATDTVLLVGFTGTLTESDFLLS